MYFSESEKKILLYFGIFNIEWSVKKNAKFVYAKNIGYILIDKLRTPHFFIHLLIIYKPLSCINDYTNLSSV